MAFHPNMKSQIEDVSLIDDFHYRAWNGAIADVWTVHCGPNANGEYISEVPRLFFALETVGEISIQFQKKNVGFNASTFGNRLSYIPAGMTVWSQIKHPGKLRHLDIHFDLDVLKQRFGNLLDRSNLERPQLLFSNPKIEQIGALLADECLSKSPLHDIYGEGLINALVAELFQVKYAQPQRCSKLSPRQLRTVTDFIEENFTRIIRLQQLAELVGLSESYFCSAFKASTGISPHAWQMQKRILHARTLLKDSEATLPHIASVLGFADQAHFTRVFKKWTGSTPAAWSRQQKH